MIELMVSVAIISVMIGMMLPAIQKVREAASQTRCVSNLRQLGISLHLYHDFMNRYPNEDTSSADTLLFVSLLPYIEQDGNYKKVKAGGIADPVEAFLCSGRRTTAVGARSDYAGGKQGTLGNPNYYTILGGNGGFTMAPGSPFGGYWFSTVYPSPSYSPAGCMWEYCYVTYGITSDMVAAGIGVSTTDYMGFTICKSYEWYIPGSGAAGNVYNVQNTAACNCGLGMPVPIWNVWDGEPAAPACPNYIPALGPFPGFATIAPSASDPGYMQYRLGAHLPTIVAAAPSVPAFFTGTNAREVTSKDGAANTIFLSHKGVVPSAYGGGDGNDPGWAVTSSIFDHQRNVSNIPPARDQSSVNPGTGFTSPHGGSVPTLYADGSVQMIDNKIAGAIWTARWTFNGGD